MTVHRKFSLGRALISLCAAIITFGAVHANALVIGVADPDVGNVFPFTANFQGSRYQQVYDAGEFTGPVLITSISFFNTQQPGAIFNGADFVFSLSTSNNAVNALDTVNFDNNVGADASPFAAVTLAGATGAQFDILAGTGGGSAFAYDPTAGDLLLDITVSGQTGEGDGGLDVMGNSGGLFSRAHNFGQGFENIGLVTGFNLADPNTPVPLPGTLLLIGLGLLVTRAVKR